MGWLAEHRSASRGLAAVLVLDGVPRLGTRRERSVALDVNPTYKVVAMS